MFSTFRLLPRVITRPMLYRQFCTVKFTFVDQKGEKEFPVEGKVGQHLLEIAHNNEIDLEGACEASLACSTCHVILEDEIYDQLEEPEEEEEDMLDLAFGLTHTS